MEKYLLKRILNEIDRYENNFRSTDDIKEHLMKRDSNLVEEDVLDNLLEYLINHEYLIYLDGCLDLIANITLFARSLNNGLCEALALLETICTNRKLQTFFINKRTTYFTLNDLITVLPEADLWFDAILKSKLLVNTQSNYSINPKIKPYMMPLFDETNQYSYLISSLTFAFFIKETLPYEKIDFRNEDREIILYDYYNKIMKILPSHGIPENRSVSENLQSFYKDILVQEFTHQCPICNINIPNMLIASHIKPFRDCGHMIESADNNNGILLCKNHDYLFDQGYISFDEDGKIMISDYIKEDKYASFNLNPLIKLASPILTRRRKQFLEYHRLNYFKHQN